MPIFNKKMLYITFCAIVSINVIGCAQFEPFDGSGSYHLAHYSEDHDLGEACIKGKQGEDEPMTDAPEITSDVSISSDSSDSESFDVDVGISCTDTECFAAVRSCTLPPDDGGRKA